MNVFQSVQNKVEETLGEFDKNALKRETPNGGLVKDMFYMKSVMEALYNIRYEFSDEGLTAYFGRKPGLETAPISANGTVIVDRHIIDVNEYFTSKPKEEQDEILKVKAISEFTEFGIVVTAFCMIYNI